VLPSTHIWACPTSYVRSPLSCSLGIHSADRSAIRHGQTQDLPVPVRKASVRARGLRPRGARTPLAISICSVLPSEQVDAVGTPKQTLFRGSIPGPHFPLSTLRLPPYNGKRMTRGRCDSLNLHRMKLSFTTLRRFYRRTNIRVNKIDSKPHLDEKTVHNKHEETWATAPLVSSVCFVRLFSLSDEEGSVSQQLNELRVGGIT
jgi:hypothetical protein